MVLDEGPNWSRRVPSKKFKICDPPFNECPQIPNFHSVVDGVDTFSNTPQCRGSAKEAIENIPDSVPVRFVGQEVGEDVWTGGSLWSYCKSYDSLKNPCFRALFDWESHTGNTSTLSWDPITLTAAAASVFTVG